MNEVLDRICDVQASDGRKLSILFQKLPSKAEYPVSLKRGLALLLIFWSEKFS
jgi:hypothetical protein